MTHRALPRGDFSASLLAIAAVGGDRYIKWDTGLPYCFKGLLESNSSFGPAAPGGTNLPCYLNHRMDDRTNHTQRQPSFHDKRQE